MSCRLVMTFSPGVDSEGGTEGSAVIYVMESFDEVMDRVMPVQSPSSNLEMRENLVYHTMEGKRISVHPNLIATVEEE